MLQYKKLKWFGFLIGYVDVTGSPFMDGGFFVIENPWESWEKNY